MSIINSQIIRQIFTIVLILLLGGLIFKEILPYFAGILGAITLYVLMKGYMYKLTKRGWYPSVAAAVLMFLSLITILLPIACLFIMLNSKMDNASTNAKKVLTVVRSQVREWEHNIGYNITDQIDGSSITTEITQNVSDIVGSTFNTFIAISIMYFLLYYMLTNQKKLKDTLIEYIPISKENLLLLNKKIQEMVYSNSVGIPLVALAQGIVAVLGFYIFGVESPLFWGIIVATGSMVPFVGSFLGIMPVFILALSNGNTFQAWGVLLYGVVVVGTTDNIIRLYVLKKLDNVHPLITLIGVIIGIPLFGFIGLIFGPLLISLFLVAVYIYKKEYTENKSKIKS